MKLIIRLTLIMAIVLTVAQVHADDFEDGVDAFLNGDYIISMQKFKALAEQGDAGAQSNLGMLYEIGKGVQQDPQKAVYWYLKAVAQGDKFAQYNLGRSYERGTGITQNYKQAVEMYRLSASHEYAPAQYNLGLMHALGRGVSQDFHEAIKWYKRSVEHGNAPAQSNLGVMYAKGYGVPKDNVEALKWFYLAAENGSDVGRNRFILEKQMTPEQIAKSQRLAKEWKKKYFDGYGS